MIGRQVGRFRIISKVGEGGMGSVWRAEDPLLGRNVAIKFLAQDTETPGSRRRFLREARATSALQHPGVAAVYEAGEDEFGRLFIAIAFVEGETISDRINAGPIPLPECVRMAAEAADALEHAHTKGVIHRDISSRNIMWSRDGRAVVIDFGIATLRDTTHLSSSGSALGTLAYVAPEILRGEPATRLSDLYGLGVVLYEMVTGRLPFAGDQPASMVYAILNSRPKAPRELRADLSPALERLIVRSMAKEPAKRYPSAAELAEALRAVRLDTPVRAKTQARAGVASAGATTTRKRRGAGDLPDKKVLAVLPFRNLTGDMSRPGADEFARGLAEALSASLARVPRLQIFPPGQPSASDDAEVDPQAAAKRLGANLVLSGHVRRSGDQIRVSYSVIDARKGSQWAGDHVDGSAQDLLALEDALLASVVRVLRVQAATARRARPLDAAGHEQYLRALGHLQRRDNEEEVDRAIELLEGLVASEGDSAPVHAALAKAYIRKAKMTFQPEWRSKADASCRIALSLDPHSPEVLVTLARLRLHTGRIEEALDALNQSLALQGQSLDALLSLVEAHELRGEFHQAERAAQEAVQLRPEYWLTHDRLALLYFRHGRYDLAASGWEKAASLVPDHHHAYSNLGSALFHLGRLKDSITAYRRSLAIHPSASALVGLGTVLFFSGDKMSGLEMLEEATRLRPGDPRTWGNLGDVQRWTPGYEAQSARSLDRSVMLLRKQLATNAEDSDSWSRLAKYLAKRGHTSESLESIDKALALAPENASSVARAVTVHHLAGDRASAIRFLRAAVEQGYSRAELCHDPELETLRHDPEAQMILKDDPHLRSRSDADTSRGGR
jgi:serine/threonine protein kinase/tetratricopeptide (TPR) repeat protein